MSFPIPVRSIEKLTKQITVDCPRLVFQFQARRLTRRVSATSMRHFFLIACEMQAGITKVYKIKTSPRSGIGKMIYHLFFILVDDESLFVFLGVFLAFIVF